MAHWIIEDKGFGGVVYRCSNCREAWDDYYSKFPKNYCRCCGEEIDEDANEYIEDLKKTGVVGKWEGIPVVSVPALIEWLSGEKYTNIDEISDSMTEEFEREHQWELSRNCFINKVIEHLEQCVGGTTKENVAALHSGSVLTKEQTKAAYEFASKPFFTEDVERALEQLKVAGNIVIDVRDQIWSKVKHEFI